MRVPYVFALENWLLTLLLFIAIVVVVAAAAAGPPGHFFLFFRNGKLIAWFTKRGEFC